MSKTFDQGKEEVAKLCQHFATNREAFLAPGVKEAHVRQTLIDPFFEALGWDVRSAAMVAPQYREVIPEDSLDVEGQQKAPDYTFRVGTLPKFYAEAKKCGVNIGADPGPAYQLRRYGWSAKLALSILTDFEELAVYDCTIRPQAKRQGQPCPNPVLRLSTSTPTAGGSCGTFSPAKPSGPGHSTSTPRPSGSAARRKWTRSFSRKSRAGGMRWPETSPCGTRDLSSDDLNAAVQSTIDRVVFLRMAEDRRLEPYEQLLKLCERDDIYPRFMRDLCRKADDKYNSGLFHFQKESDVSRRRPTASRRS